MKGWGIDARLESWGPFGRGWEFTHFSAHMFEPRRHRSSVFRWRIRPAPTASSPAKPTVAIIANDADIERYRGKLKDKIVFLGTGPRAGDANDAGGDTLHR